MRNGFLDARASWRATLSSDGGAEPTTHGLNWRMASTDQSGGDLRVIASGYAVGLPNIANIVMGQPFTRSDVSGTGIRKLLLQLSIDPYDNTSAASVHSAQFDGLYAA